MGKAELPLHAPGTQLDRGYIGQSVPRPNAARLLQGRGAFTDDLRFPRLAHVAFFRSPYAHARIKKLQFETASKAPGVIAVFDGPTVAEYCTPWVAVLAHLKGIKSPPQHAIAIERACWQGEAVAAVVAESRSQAEDAVQLIEAEWEPLPVVVDMEEALEGKTIIHPEFADNVCFKREHDTGGVDEAFASADVVVEETFGFGRHTGVCLEGRAILADYNAAEHSLTVYHATQAPHMMQDIFSRHLGIPEANVRVIAKDIGGSFGIKVHVYPDEMATAAISVILRRPVKFVADRLESFISDIHAREHRVKVRLACSKSGEILAFDLDDLTSIGPYSVYPRTSGIEGNQVVNLTGGPYKHQKYRAKMNVVFTNKNVTCQYRAVGHPIAVALTEGIVDLAANKLGMDPAEFRRNNLIADDAYPYTFPSGIKFEKLSHHKTLDLLLKTMGYEKLKKERDDLRRKGIYRGIGLAAMIEVTNPSPAFYGVGGARISAQDGATLRLEPTGMLTVMCSVTEQGQGTEGIFAQIAASAVGVSMEKVRVITGDTGVTPYGGGTWASRGAGIGGEAVLLAGRALRSNMLDIAAAILKLDKQELDVLENTVVNRLTREPRMPLAELGRVAYFRPDTLPLDFQAELTVTRHYTPRQYGFTFTNGIQASLVHVDPDTGFVKLLKHWCVEDSGTLINPMLVDEQIRGGVVQGIGAALFEECLYSADGQLLNGNMADYLVPMSGEMPDIVCAHIETPTKQSQLGAKGVGEAGTAGAPGAVMNAVNDALLPLGARVTAMPFTPERILKALGKVVCAIGIALGILAAPAPASAQFPDKPVHLVVPVGPGGGTDLLARHLARKLSDSWGQPVVVENKAGGAGIIGAEGVIRSAADGTTLLLSHDGVITATPILYKRPDFDPVKQLSPITQLATIPYVVVVHPSVQARNIPELIALMKAKSARKESFGFATSALGSADHLGGEQFKIAAGVDMLIVPYKSAAPATADVIAGHLPMGFFTVAGTQPHIKAGTLRALGITSGERSKLFPDLQTVGETLPGFVAGAWYGLWAPAGTPAALVEKISSDVRRIVESPDLAAYLLNNGFVAATSTPAEFAEFIRRDSAKTAQVIKSANVRIE